MYADEFVNWFNQVDATYRSEFKDLFEVHFARFEAGLEQVRAELETRIEASRADVLATLERRLGEQTRWPFGALAVVLGSVIGLWFRG